MIGIKANRPNKLFQSRQEVAAWMIEAFLHTTPNVRHTLKEVLRSPCFFPFHIDQKLTGHRIAQSGRVEVIHQGGLSEDMVVLSQLGKKMI
jgi:hypothetical protein